MKLHPILCALALSAAGSPTFAIVNGVDPATTPPIVPYTNVATPNWKFVGKVAGSASAVQVAPRWILASRHATPPVGAAFTNAFGTATVASCVFPTATYSATTDNDLSLCRLNTVIALPAGTALPEVVGFPRPSAYALANYDHWGYVLGSGYSTGTRRSAWSTFSGIDPLFDPYDIALNPTSRYLNIDAIKLAYTAGGDSGGGVYFYPFGATTGAGTGRLIGVLTGEATIGSSPTYLTPAFAQWIVQTIAGQGDVAPVLADMGQIVGDTTSRLPAKMASGSVTAAVTGPTTASVSFTAPTINATYDVAPNRFLVITKGVGVATPIVNLRTAGGTYPLTGLTDGRQYQSCVITGNSLGYGTNVTIFLGTKMLERPGCAFFVAGAPNVPGASWDFQVTKNPSTGKADLAGHWDAPVANGVTVGSYVVTVKVWPTWGVATTTPAIRTTTVQTSAKSFSLANVLSGKEYGCWQVAARSPTQTVGPASTSMCFLAP